MSGPNSKMGRAEFISLMALLMSFVALTIDAMLPALGQIGKSLEVKNDNDVQWVISSVFFGMSFGLLIFGPISDSFGRKRSIFIGMGICILGSFFSYFSENLIVMLLGRVLQGFGAASCRVVTLAMIRDLYNGREMGRIMSQILVFFILVPALAPTIGQGILFIADWRAIFGLFIILGIISVIWLYTRQPETLASENIRVFSKSNIIDGMVETIKNSIALTYMIAGGIIFGAFVGYLSTAQQILQVQYNLGESFSLYFGALALAIGFASFVNSKLLLFYKMEKICLISLTFLTLTAFAFNFYSQGYGGHPPLLFFMIFCGITFFCIGLLFGNFNTLALQPLGHLAGTANSVIGFVQTMLSMLIGGVIGQSYSGTVEPLVVGFFVCGLVSWLILIYNLKSHN